MKFICINNSSETYTPTASGAIATGIWQTASAARVAGDHPVVITRDSAVAPYPDPAALFLPYPRILDNRLGTFLCRAERKLDGWRHFRQRAYAARVHQALLTHSLSALPLVLHNDPEMAVYLAHRLPRAAVFHVFHNHLECKSRFRALYKKTNIISIAVSNFTARWVEENYNLPPNSVATLYNGVDLDRFTPSSHTNPADTAPVIGFVGRTGVEKAPDLLLKAALLVAQKTKKFSLQIVGSNHWGPREMDTYQTELESLIADLTAQGIPVRQTGFVGRDNLPAEIRRTHIHVVPSRWDEAFGLTTLEGMACGVAVVASATGGTPEVVGDAGLLFPRDSAAALADRLLLLIENPGLRQDLAARALARARRFSWANTHASLAALIHSQSPATATRPLPSEQPCTSAA